MDVPRSGWVATKITGATRTVIGRRFEDFYYDSERKLGVVILPKKEGSEYKQIKVFIFNRGYFRTLFVRYDDKKKEGRNLKLRILNALEYKHTNKRMAKVIYKKFKDFWNIIQDFFVTSK